ncbi:MAG: hypothetical protein K0S76_892 [Herbinix sp.]|jgi:subtilisin family serine protease|nr:hypothetical protein [Herbinix sp.]
MTQEERYKITSNEYADLIIPYNENIAIFEKYKNYSVHIMNSGIAILYIPVKEFNQRINRTFGYSAIPTCFGITNERSLEVSGVNKLRRLPVFDLRGKGVLIGILDSGIDYTNPIFQYPDGTTKIVAIWDQTIDSVNGYPSDTFYGTEYIREQINEALANENPYDVVPSRDEIGHGTMMAGIAAGSSVIENKFSGVVPDSELVIVKLKQAKSLIRGYFVIPEEIPCYQENDIMWGAQYLIRIARKLNRPIAIAVGLGTSSGAHDGRGYLSSLLSIGGDFPGVTVTIAAGNEGNARRHYYGTINPSIGYETVELYIDENETGFSMEIWGRAPNTYSIDILSPSGEYVPRIMESLFVSRQVSFVFEETEIIVDYHMVESQTGDQLILLRFRKPSPGIWRFQVYGRGDLKGTFHAWLPMNGFLSDKTYFVQSNPYTTITSPGNATVPITVTAYNPYNEALYTYAGRGYSRIDTIKPELAAPGVNMLSPNLEHGFMEVSGTSVAAAHTAGITAMLLEWGTVRGNYPGIDTVEIKKFLVKGARRNDLLMYPNRDWGYGLLDIYNVFNTLRSSILKR